MKIHEARIPDVKVLEPTQYRDSRGFFSEVWNRRTMAEAGLDLDFVQDNQSYSAAVGTVRGLHFQTPPFAQDKLVRVTRGAILDVAVDLRKGSPTFGRHVAVELSAARWNQMLVPAGFAHGFCTLEPDCEVLYKVTGYYSPAHDKGVLWSDPDIGIVWPVEETVAALSDKDRAWPFLREIDSPFTYAELVGEAAQ